MTNNEQDPLQGLRKEIQTAVASLTHQLDSIARTVTASIEQQIQQSSELVAWFKIQFPPEMSRALEALGRRGWYLDFEWSMTELRQVVNMFEQGREDAAERFLVQHFTSRLDEIERNICERLPQRARIVRRCFALQREKDYISSVPMTLIQADGACWDLTNGRSLFRRVDGRPEVAQAAIVDSDWITGAYSSILRESWSLLPIVQNEKERGPNFAGLNRHMVLHGEAVDYGTSVNSLRAVSLLNYVVSVFGD